MDVKTACEFFFAPIEQDYRDLCEIYANGFPFDAVICDAALHMSRIVAEKLPAKVYVVAPAPTPAPTSPTAPAPFFGFKPARSVLGRLRDRAVTWLLASKLKQGVAMFNELRQREGLAPYAGTLFDIHVEKSRAIFQIGVPGLDFPRDDWPANFRFIGALLPEPRATGLSPALEAKLARYPTAILVSQGTTDNRDPDKLFVPSLEALAGSQHLVIITTGGRHTEALRHRFSQDNVVIEDWVDFHALLPQIDLFICNGGYGSVLLALSYGVPLLCAGKLEGKADINARLDYRGLAVDLRTERPTKHQIGKAVVRVLGDSRYVERVRELQMSSAAIGPVRSSSRS